MFSLATGCLSSQLTFPLSYSVSQMHSMQPARVSNALRRQQKLQNTAAEQLNQTLQSVKVIRSNMGLNTITIDNLPKVLSQSILSGPTTRASTHNQVRQYSKLLSSRPSWHESHASYSSFSENKQGFSTSYSMLQSFLSKCQTLNPAGPLCNGSRGFKTKYSIREPSRTAQTLEFAKLGIKPQRVDGSSKEKLNALLAEETDEATQKNIKIAFAEGYISGDGKSQKTLWDKFLFFGQIVLLSCLTFSMFLLLSGGSAAIRMRGTNENEVQPEDINVTFEDVRGAEEAKAELEEIVDFLKNPGKYTSLGAELPKGVILVGQPGTGKTLLARAVAGEAGVPFFHAAGSEFDEVLVGQGAKRIRDLFAVAKTKAPCVIFIDEIDSVGSKRTSSALHPFANQTINQLLSELDGFVKNEGVIVLGATNRRGDLDKALLRPGRFDVEVHVPIPDLVGRSDIFSYYMSKVKYGPDVDIDVLSRGTTGFTGADIKNIVNQAALKAAANHEIVVSMHHLEEARDKVLMGPKKKSRIPDEETNVVTAYHEGGHAIVSHYTHGCHPLHKVTIIPRGPSLGHTAFIPAKEQYNLTRTQMLASMDSLLGGRAAEEIIFGLESITTGASSDLEKATQIATSMVKDMGMSEKVGLRTFNEDMNVAIKVDTLSLTTKETIDSEIKRILQESYERAKAILKLHAREHKDLAEALLKYETLDAKDIQAIVDGKAFTKTTS